MGAAYSLPTMPDTASPLDRDLYDRDFFAWTQDQAARLRAWPEHLRPNGIDVANLVEEVESLGKSDRRAIESFLEFVVLHVLKLEFHPERQAQRHWMREVNTFRASLRRLYRQNPSLQAQRADMLVEVWRDALGDFRRDLAVDAPEHVAGFDAILPPDSAPRYDVDTEILADGWYPPPHAG